MNGTSDELARLETQYASTKKEWRYEMRREAQEILPGVFVGPFQPSWHLETLQSLGITHILCIAESREQHLFRAKFPDRFVYRILDIRDADDQNLIRIFPDSQKFIDECLSQGGRVLVHCGDGLSRSPAIVTGYVMVKTGLTHEDAFQFVQNRRFCIAPRTEFQHQLEAYRPIYLASQMMPSHQQQRQQSQMNGSSSRRRTREESSDEEETAMRDTDSTQRIPNWTPADVVMSS